jgi:hypothetical protein
VQACSWTGDCAVVGCEGKCVANSETLSWSLTLSDFAMSETDYRFCPVLALFVTLIGSGGGGSSGVSSPSTATPPVPAAAPTTLDFLIEKEPQVQASYACIVKSFLERP